MTIRKVSAATATIFLRLIAKIAFAGEKMRTIHRRSMDQWDRSIALWPTNRLAN
tara:strand:+ start:51066 stop:51227 length:162 start_codon:yes stop_codon:yes gene_type:complete